MGRAHGRRAGTSRSWLDAPWFKVTTQKAGARFTTRRVLPTAKSNRLGLGLAAACGAETTEMAGGVRGTRRVRLFQSQANARRVESHDLP